MRSRMSTTAWMEFPGKERDGAENPSSCLKIFGSRRLWSSVQMVKAFLYIHWLGICDIVKQFFQEHEDFEISSKVIFPNKGRWAVVTGCTSGLGLEVVKKLYMCEMNVVMGCRDYLNGQRIAHQIQTELGRGRNHGARLIASELDLRSLSSVETFARHVLDVTNTCVHVLINNAGVMFPPHALTSEGINDQLQTNHFGHFSLMYHLLPGLRHGGRRERVSRIVNVSSIAYSGNSFSRLMPIDMDMRCGTYLTYMNSKFAQVCTSVLWRRFFRQFDNHIRITSVHPGIVNTDLYRHVFYKKLVAPLMPLISKTPSQGADGIIFAALSPKLENYMPVFMSNCQELKELEQIYDTGIQILLWLVSCGLTGTPVDLNPLSHVPFPKILSEYNIRRVIIQD